jgi:hypothetical protein
VRSKRVHRLDLEGSHVQKEDSSDKEIYIIPLCKEHFESVEVLDIFDDVPFISADVKKICLANVAKVSEVVKEGERLFLVGIEGTCPFYIFIRYSNNYTYFCDLKITIKE